LGGVVILVLSAGAFGVLWFGGQFHELPGMRLDSVTPGNRAEIINVVYGLPLTLVGALIGIVVTSLGVLLTTRQGDVELLKFARSTLTPTIRNYSELVECIGRLAVVGNASLALADELVPKVELRGSSLREILEDIDATLARPENDQLRLLAQAIDTELRSTALSVGACLRSIAQDPYSESFQRLQLELLPRDRRPLNFLRGLGVANPLVNDQVLSENMHALADNLIEYGSNTGLIHYLAAYALTPSQIDTQDHLGHALLSRYCELKRPLKSKGNVIYGYTLNIGSAWLLTLIAFIPTRQVIEKVFDQLLRERGEIVTRFLKIAGPDRDLFGSPFTFGSALDALKHPERLVIVRLEGGETEYYDPRRHGEIPRRGYVWETEPAWEEV
jgi:hypothetical protein